MVGTKSTLIKLMSSMNQKLGLALWDHRDPLMAFKQRSSTLELHFRWITLTVRVVDRFKRDKNKTEDAITIV